jgi:hypothetical protein
LTWLSHQHIHQHFLKAFWYLFELEKVSSMGVVFEKIKVAWSKFNETEITV